MLTKKRNVSAFIANIVAAVLLIAIGVGACFGVMALHWEINFAPKEVDKEVFLENKSDLSQTNVDLAYLSSTRKACRNAVEDYYGGKIIDDYVVVWNDNGIYTLSYYYEDAKACYRITTDGKDSSVAYGILNYKDAVDGNPVASFDGEAITFSQS